MASSFMLQIDEGDSQTSKQQKQINE